MRRVLVVDDEVLNRLILSTMLADWVENVDQAADGREALQFLADQPYDMLFLDIHMPLMSGLEVAATLRAEPGPNRDVPIVAVTADLTRSPADYRALGFDGLIEKPISFGTVRRGLAVRRSSTNG